MSKANKHRELVFARGNCPSLNQKRCMCKKPSKVEKKLPYKCSTSSLPSKSYPSQRMEEKTGGEGTYRLGQPVRASSHGS